MLQAGPALLVTKPCRATARARRLMRKHNTICTTITYWIKAEGIPMEDCGLIAKTVNGRIAVTLYSKGDVTENRQTSIAMVQREFK